MITASSITIGVATDSFTGWKTPIVALNFPRTFADTLVDLLFKPYASDDTILVGIDRNPSTLDVSAYFHKDIPGCFEIDDPEAIGLVREIEDEDDLTQTRVITGVDVTLDRRAADQFFRAIGENEACYFTCGYEGHVRETTYIVADWLFPIPHLRTREQVRGELYRRFDIPLLN